MNLSFFSRALLISFLLLETGTLYAHDHLAAGSASTAPGAPLVFVNAADFGSDSGFVFNLNPGKTNANDAGLYSTDEVVFAALAATGDNGGPEPLHAGLGAHIEIQLLGVDGPTGAVFSFWDATSDGVDSTNVTWNVPVPYAEGTNLISVSENDGSPGVDPYGHVHGRLYSVSKAGLYKTTWRFIDTSSNGPNGGPVNTPSAPFSLYFQADLTLGSVAIAINGLTITFAAPSNLPDDSPSVPPTQYFVERAATLGSQVSWQIVSDPVIGDDHLHQVPVPVTGLAQFFRLRAQ